MGDATIDSSKYLDVFIEESRENLQTLNDVLLSLEENGFDEDGMNEAFRSMHTLKGTAGILGIDSIQNFAHVMEDLFDIIRDRGEMPDKPLLELLFDGVDTIERMIVELERSGSTNISTGDLIDKMKSVMNGTPSSQPKQVDVPSIRLEPEQLDQVRELLGENERPLLIGITWSDGLKFKEGRAYQIVRNISDLGSILATAPALEEVQDSDQDFILVVGTTEGDDELLKVVRENTGVASVLLDTIEMHEASSPMTSISMDVSNNSKLLDEDVEADTARKEKPVELSTGSSIRIKSKLLDDLLDLVGEIMINNIRINQVATNLKHRELKQTLQNNTRLMAQLQDIVLRMRMVQVDFIFKRFPRIVRDLARANEKEVDFIMRGTDIEIDRSLLDEVGDALVHLLRNAVDHGIEPMEQRVANGKPPRGTIILSALQEQSNIIITVEDDGRGMNTDTIVANAIAKGIVSAEEIERLDDRTKLQLVFLPGFSTADKVTDISGRGVGMDVVKTKIESLGGFIRLDSTLGKGCKITLKLPPSMSIIRAMLIEVNNEKYAIPLDNVRETVRVPMSDIHEVAGHGMFKLREEVLPVLNIQSEFGSPKTQTDDADDMPAIIVEKNDSRVCLLVSRLIGQQEIVVKNLSKDLRQTGYFSGATILGDGKVAMILDVGAFV